MPPANSPTVSRPSTPPVNPYIRQLEEAISTPVPDLASTLNLSTNSFDRTRSHSLTLEDQYADTAPDIFTTSNYLTEHEFFQPSDMNPNSQSQSTSPPHQPHVTTDMPPSTESLYDWAATGRSTRPTLAEMLADESGDRELDRDLDRISTVAASADPESRRDLLRLERALQNYRNARQALRSGPSARASEIGAVPTAGALRAYWQGEAEDHTSASSRPWLPPLNLSSPSRRTYAEYNRLHPEARSQQSDTRSWSPVAEPKTSEAFSRVQNLIRYLSQLRNTGLEGGLILAQELGLDSLYESEGSNVPSDLPMHINSLPTPEYSSWLQPGMVWHGLQSTDREPIRTAAMMVSNARRERQREIYRRSLSRRRRLGWEASNPDIDPFPSNDAQGGDRWLSDLRQNINGRWGFAQPTLPSTSTPTTRPSLENPGSDHWPVHVTIHSVDYNNMTMTGTMSASHIPDKSSVPQPLSKEEDFPDTSMSSFFTGEIIDFRQQPLETESKGRSYSVGGLDVDARYWARLGPFRQEMEKVRSLRGKNRNEYQQDSRLWDAFRKAASGDAENKESNSEVGQSSHASGALDETAPTTETFQPSGSHHETQEISHEAEDDEVMARSLGSAKWITEKLNKEWILMRWKERCFVNSGSKGSDSALSSTTSQSQTGATRTIVTSTRPANDGVGSVDPNSHTNGSTSWGLTISGFYYIALNRMTGEIDGLYYDPGSQPYQALKMVPEGTVLRDRPGHKAADGRTQTEESSLEFGARCGCGNDNCNDRVGLKRWFPSLEFR